MKKIIDISLIVLGIASVLLIAFMIFASHVMGKRSGDYYSNKENEADRNLKLVVLYDFAQTSKTITEKATAELIVSTMKSTDWEKFHFVYLEDKNGNTMDVSGSLYEDGLSSSYVNDDVHLLKANPPESVEEMTEILLDFLKGEDLWRNKYKYE